MRQASVWALRWIVEATVANKNDTSGLGLQIIVIFVMSLSVFYFLYSLNNCLVHEMVISVSESP